VSNYNFQGAEGLTLDGKGRVTMPARHRQQLGEVCGDEVTITKGQNGCLYVFPRPAWEDFKARLLLLPMAADNWRSLFLGSAMDVSVDSASRFMVSPELRRYGALDREVILEGVGKRFNLWDAARHAAHEAATLQTPLPQSLQDFVM
jgi:MraZ protein